MRDFFAVVGDALGVIPKEHALHARVEAIRNTAAYTPPECRVGNWRQLINLLESELPSPHGPDAEAWMLTLSQIMTGKK